MVKNSTEIGIVIIIFAAFFLLSGLEMLDFQMIDPRFSTVLAFVMVAIGVYMVGQKKE